ncbi:hypothetical protein CAPTEDRAFT_215248 [Capitella teleta]|uniref:Reverse transcriptase domain-containing protein n=1 Tax=Capitella teleta TaxID=283909 RepID=R7VKL0_CAPTE|nr:hypothetical protein CAPTEDRAFT_215248 [Capitella teleta]|eukprot:ELU17471.1 hypothetical protein CAPTEDRAFT_215248 [Capitella teleta]
MFSIIHHNIRSANANLNNLEMYIDSLRHPFTIIPLTETWFNASNVSSHSIPGYNHSYRCRSRPGGVLDCNVAPVKDTTPLVRNINNETINQFTLSLQEIDWASVYAHETCQEAYTVFHATFSALYNEHFPLQNKQSKYKARKSWLSDELKHHIKTKNKLFKKYKRNPTFTNEQI